MSGTGPAPALRCGSDQCRVSRSGTGPSPAARCGAGPCRVSRPGIGPSPPALRCGSGRCRVVRSRTGWPGDVRWSGRWSGRVPDAARPRPGPGPTTGARYQRLAAGSRSRRAASAVPVPALAVVLARRRRSPRPRAPAYEEPHRGGNCGYSGRFRGPRRRRIARVRAWSRRPLADPRRQRTARSGAGRRRPVSADHAAGRHRPKSESQIAYRHWPRSESQGARRRRPMSWGRAADRRHSRRRAVPRLGRGDRYAVPAPSGRWPPGLGCSSRIRWFRSVASSCAGFSPPRRQRGPFSGWRGQHRLLHAPWAFRVPQPRHQPPASATTVPRQTKRAARPHMGSDPLQVCPAASYSPTRSPAQYHRR